MKIIFLTAALITLFTSGNAIAQSDQSKSDQRRIEQVIDNWNKAWRTKDFKLASQDYSEDADWTNAFGMKRKGRAEIEKLLAEVFALPFVMAGESTPAEQSVKFIKPDIALVTTRVERQGQQAASGSGLGTRQTSHLRVLVRSGKQWKIISHLISDARDTQQERH